MGVETDSSNHNTADRNEVEIRTGRIGKKTVQVRMAAVNVLCFKDVIAEGTMKLESRELHIRRFRKFARQQRKRKIDDDVYNEQKSYGENGVEHEETVFEMSKLKRWRRA